MGRVLSGVDQSNFLVEIPWALVSFVSSGYLSYIELACDTGVSYSDSVMRM
jgi:hypothetical protein